MVSKIVLSFAIQPGVSRKERADFMGGFVNIRTGSGRLHYCPHHDGQVSHMATQSCKGGWEIHLAGYAEGKDLGLANRAPSSGHQILVLVALVVKKPPANAGDITDAGSIPGSERSPGGGHHNPLQYSCLENPKDRGAWWATVHRIAKSWTQLKRLRLHPTQERHLEAYAVILDNFSPT